MKEKLPDWATTSFFSDYLLRPDFLEDEETFSSSSSSSSDSPPCSASTLIVLSAMFRQRFVRFLFFIECLSEKICVFIAPKQLRESGERSINGDLVMLDPLGGCDQRRIQHRFSDVFIPEEAACIFGEKVRSETTLPPRANGEFFPSEPVLEFAPPGPGA